MQSDTESTCEDESAFYFESDHLALRGNRDYCNVLRCIMMLQAQKMRVHQQLEELHEAQRRYLDNPELLLEKIRNNEPIISPNYITVVNIPEVSNYDTFPTETLQVKKEHDELNVPLMPKSEIARGRHADASKSETYNQLWSNEEQRRLEQLLIEYPPEEVEMRRFVKIAKALGNRTPQQVSSRVQKYFLKLHEAGMPVPGRLPKYRRQGVNKQKHFYRPSTFFPAHNVSVHMPEDDFMLDDLQQATQQQMEQTLKIKTEIKEEPSTELKLPQEEVDSSHKLYVKMLKAIRDEKIKTADGYNPDPLAPKCENCEEDFVARTRWRCNSCYCYLSLCLDCLTNQLVTKTFEHITHDVVIEQEHT